MNSVKNTLKELSALDEQVKEIHEHISNLNQNDRDVKAVIDKFKLLKNCNDKL